MDNWLNYSSKDTWYSFSVFEVSENKKFDNEIKKILNQHILDSYRGIDFLKLHFESTEPEELVKYLESETLPSMVNTTSKNVWQWDCGEILSLLIAQYFQGLSVPLRKMRFKFNKEKSVFSTDLVAHNKWDTLTDMYYYEIKTKQDICNKDYSVPGGQYITVVAYKWLEKDESCSNEAICDFLSRRAFDKGDLKESIKYNKVVKWDSNLSRNFEIFIIWEKSTYKEDILEELNNISPSLSPLNVTIVLIDWFKDLIEQLRDKITDDAVDIVYN